MKPKKYPYSGRKERQERPADGTLPDLVVLPNVAFRKELIKHIYMVTRYHGDCAIIYFRIPKIFGGYDEKTVKVKLSYEETLKMLNSY